MAASIDRPFFDTETQFSQQCIRVLAKVLHEMPRGHIHDLCINIVQSIESESILGFFGAINFAGNTQSDHKSRPTSRDVVVSEYDNQRILVLNSREAFSSPYESTHAMTAFLEYLDVQWLKMIEDWKPQRGTLHSRCGTIVQSSCAGKSRLVERFTSRAGRD